MADDVDNIDVVDSDGKLSSMNGTRNWINIEAVEGERFFLLFQLWLREISPINQSMW